LFLFFCHAEFLHFTCSL